MSPQTEWAIVKSYNRRHGVPAAFWALMLILSLGALCVLAGRLYSPLYPPSQRHFARGQR